MDFDAFKERMKNFEKCFDHIDRVRENIDGQLKEYDETIERVKKDNNIKIQSLREKC